MRSRLYSFLMMGFLARSWKGRERESRSMISGLDGTYGMAALRIIALSLLSGSILFRLPRCADSLGREACSTHTNMAKLFERDEMFAK